MIGEPPFVAFPSQNTKHGVQISIDFQNCRVQTNNACLGGGSGICLLWKNVRC